MQPHSSSIPFLFNQNHHITFPIVFFPRFWPDPPCLACRTSKAHLDLGAESGCNLTAWNFLKFRMTSSLSHILAVLKTSSFLTYTYVYYVAELSLARLAVSTLNSSQSHPTPILQVSYSLISTMKSPIYKRTLLLCSLTQFHAAKSREVNVGGGSGLRKSGLQ